MMNEGFLKKSLVCAIIILLIGVTVAPSVTCQVNKINLILPELSENIIAKNNDLVMVDVRLCKDDESKNHVVFLTKEKATELDNLLNDFKTKLDNAETLEEIYEIYDNAILSLNKFGLLPDDISVEEAQKLVTGNYKKYEKIRNLLKKTFTNNILEDDHPLNKFCFVAGDLERAVDYNLFILFAVFFMAICLAIAFSGVCPELADKLAMISDFLFGYSFLKPLHLLNVVNVQSDRDCKVNSFISIGSMGRRDFVQPESGNWFLDIIGFSGLNIVLKFSVEERIIRELYLGTAIFVDCQPLNNN